MSDEKITIQNRVMGNQELALRYTRDENGRPIRVRCDARGCVEVSKREADFLSRTPGWNVVRPKDARPPLPPAAEPPRSRVRTIHEGPQNAPMPNPNDEEKASEKGEGEENAEESAEEAPDIDGLRTKADAVKLASKWRAKGYEIPELDPDSQKLSEMKEILAEALLEDEEG